MTTTLKTIELPPPGFPMLATVITNPILPEQGKDPIVWAVSRPHPFVPNAKVMRMFVGHGVVEIYSVSEDGRTGMRDLIPMHWTRSMQEAMPIEVFVDEIVEAEREAAAGDEDDEDDGEYEPNAPEEQPVPANGQPTP